MSSLQWKLLVIVLIGASGSAQTVAAADNVITSVITRVLRRDDLENIIFSPQMVMEAVMQLYLGADGNTAQQIEKALKLPSDNSKSKTINGVIKNVGLFKSNRLVTYKKASGIFVTKEINVEAEYKEKYKDYFNSTVVKVNFGDVKDKITSIGAWITKKTNLKISRVVQKIAKETQIMQIGATLFRAKWKDPFHVNETRSASFYMPLKMGGFQVSTVNTMSRKGKYQYMFVEKLNAYSIKIPYDDPELSMLVLLPKSMSGVQRLVEDLHNCTLHELDPQDTVSNFRITLPKFKLVSVVSVKGALQSLGIKHLFEKANLHGMTGSEKWHVDDIIQKSYIDVDEGSKAVPIDMEEFGSITRQFVGEVDHPFVFLVMDTKTVYVAGRVNKL